MFINIVDYGHQIIRPSRVSKCLTALFSAAATHCFISLYILLAACGARRLNLLALFLSLYLFFSGDVLCISRAARIITCVVVADVMPVCCWV
jgi:hypothetical protein